jgi:hypothetical protein
MRLYYSVFSLVICFALLSFFTSCKIEEESLEKVATEEVTSDIDSVTYWYKNHIYLIKKKNFTIHSALIIEKGTVIKFDPDSGRSISVVDSGLISAQGSSSYPIVFTSLYDDMHGGDNNLDGSLTTARTGDWDFIYLNNKFSCSFNNVYFLYGGGNAQSSTLVIDSCNAEIKNCTFAHNKGGDLNEPLGALNANNAKYLTKIDNNIFYDNELPLTINTAITIDNTNRFYNPMDTAQYNRFNIIVINTESPVSHFPQWKEKKVALVVSGNNLKINNSNQLLLGNYVTLKFSKGCLLWLQSGASSILNFDGPGVQLTSIFDDKIKGDSNGDNGLTQPAEGDWNIFINSDEDAVNWRNIFYVKRNTGK